LQNRSLSVECEFCAWKEKADSAEQHNSKIVGGEVGVYDFEWVFAGEVALCQEMHLYNTFCYLIFLCRRWCSLSLGGRMQPSSTPEVSRGGGGG